MSVRFSVFLFSNHDLVASGVSLLAIFPDMSMVRSPGVAEDFCNSAALNSVAAFLLPPALFIRALNSHSFINHTWRTFVECLVERTSFVSCSVKNVVQVGVVGRKSILAFLDIVSSPFRFDLICDMVFRSTLYTQN